MIAGFYEEKGVSQDHMNNHNKLNSKLHEDCDREDDNQPSEYSDRGLDNN